MEPVESEVARGAPSRDVAWDSAAFESFAAEVQPRIVRALVTVRGADRAVDAAAEAVAHAWEHWEEVRVMANPAGYLYRVAQSRSRERKRPVLPAAVDIGLPDVEPGLVPALLELPLTQRTAVWLVHGCGWSYAETAVAMGASETAVSTHLARGMTSLRRQLGVVS